jgi:hypothetical protein
MTAPTIVAGYTQNGNAGNSTTLIINTPTHANGDMIFVVWESDGDSSTASISGGGWTVLEGPQNVPAGATANAGAFYVWYKTASGEGASYTITQTVSERALAIAFAVTGAGGINAEATYSSGTDTSAEVGSVTSTVADTLRISTVVSNGVKTVSTLAGHTLLATHDYASAGTISVQYKTLASSGVDAGQTATLSTSSWGAYAWAIAPTGGTPVTVALAADVVVVAQPAATVDALQTVTVALATDVVAVAQPAATVVALQTVTVALQAAVVAIAQPAATVTTGGAVIVALAADVVAVAQPAATVVALQTVTVALQAAVVAIAQPTATVTTGGAVIVALAADVVAVAQPAATVVALQTVTVALAADVVAIAQPAATVTTGDLPVTVALGVDVIAVGQPSLIVLIAGFVDVTARRGFVLNAERDFELTAVRDLALIAERDFELTVVRDFTLTSRG